MLQKTLFSSGVGVNEGEIWMDDTSEEALKSLVAFIYFDDIKKPLESNSVALVKNI